MLASSSSYSPTMEMEATFSSETQVYIQCNPKVPEILILRANGYEYIEIR
jgi:hypothetical protein